MSTSEFARMCGVVPELFTLIKTEPNPLSVAADNDFYVAPSMSNTPGLLEDRRRVFDWRLKHLTDIIKEHQPQYKGSVIELLPLADLPVSQSKSERISQNVG